MENIKKYLISLGITLGLIIIFSLFLNVFNYFELINGNFYKMILILTSALSVAVGSFILGEKTDNKGYLEGIKFGLITIILFFVISFLAFDQKITTLSFIYYLILVITSSVGAMFGINKKASKEK